MREYQDKILEKIIEKLKGKIIIKLPKEYGKGKK